MNAEHRPGESDEDVDYNDPRVAGAAPVDERTEVVEEDGENPADARIPADPDRPTDPRTGNVMEPDAGG